jgi:glucosamine kinase
MAENNTKIVPLVQQKINHNNFKRLCCIIWSGEQSSSNLVLFWYYHTMHSSEHLFLGIDGGGSHCRARIRDGAGRLLGEAVGGSANIYQDLEGALAAIVATAAEAAEAAGVKPDRLHAGLGLAGIVTSVGAERIQAAGLPFASVFADNDAFAACMGAFAGGDGGIVIAGTGSIGFAFVGGRRHMVGGWGFALGDHGSGAWIGHHAVRRAALALDGLLQPTRLVDEVLQRVGRTRFDLSRWSERAAPRDYAKFAPLVFDCAAKADVQGMTIVIEGAAAISMLGRALLARGAGRLCLLGGLGKVYPPYLDADVRAALAAPEADAMDGAIMMARKAHGLPERWT